MDPRLFSLGWAQIAVVFTIVSALMCLSVIRGAAMRQANAPYASATISLEDFTFEVPQGWQRGKSDREKTQALLVELAGGAIAGMIQVDVGKPALPTATDTARSFAGADGRVLSDSVALDGVAGVRVETPSTDLSRPRFAVVVHRGAKVYLVMAAAANNNDVSTALDHVVASWRWLNP